MDFTLTTGKTIWVPDAEFDGSSFDWILGCSYAELDMECSDDSSQVTCKTKRADEHAKMVKTLYNCLYDLENLKKHLKNVIFEDLELTDDRYEELNRYEEFRCEIWDVFLDAETKTNKDFENSVSIILNQSRS